MDRKPVQKVLFLSAFAFLAGCSYFEHWGAGNTYATSEYEAEVVTETVVVPVASEQRTDNSGERFINYRETTAEYREFGERTPRDQRIVSAGAGSNLSASIPPTIDEEVSDYETEINLSVSENFDANSDGDNGEFASEDPVEDWLAEEGSTLKGLLTDWSQRAGWRLIWNTNRNYTLSAGAMFRGRFADVSSALIRSFARARPAPLATFYKGNRVLVVETKDDENAFN